MHTVESQFHMPEFCTQKSATIIHDVTGYPDGRCEQLSTSSINRRMRPPQAILILNFNKYKYFYVKLFILYYS